MAKDRHYLTLVQEGKKIYLGGTWRPRSPKVGETITVPSVTRGEKEVAVKIVKVFTREQTSFLKSFGDVAEFFGGNRGPHRVWDLFSIDAVAD